MAPDSCKVKRTVLSEVSFERSSDLNSVKNQLRRVKATGKLVIHVSQGGINAVVFEARNSLDGEPHIELLFDTPALP